MDDGRAIDATDASSACAFCRIARGQSLAEVIYKTETVMAFFPDEPITLGHTLVIPRVHVADFLVASNEIACDVVSASRHVGKYIMRALSAEGLNVITSVGEAASQSVFHLHVHVVPRWQNDAFGELWPKSPKISSSSKTAAAAKIRAALSDGPMEPGG
jgi:histidine triad (HIT) family protein